MNNKTIWITGASSGIGAETAKQLAQQGATVAISARSKDKLKALESTKGLSGAIHAYPCDITDAAAIAKTIQSIEKDLGNIDIALLNAGTYISDPIDTFTLSDFEKQFQINVFGTANCFKPLIDIFSARGQGHIAIVSSVAGYRGLPRSIAYGATKAALINMSEALYLECKPLGIKIQLICPGFVKTPLTDKNDFEMPMIMPVEDAATALIKGLKGNKFEITFPRTFAILLKTIGLLPDKAYLWLIGKSTQGKL